MNKEKELYEILTDFLTIGSNLPGEVGSFFQNSMPNVQGIVLCAIIVAIIIKIPPIPTFFKYAEREANREPVEPEFIQLYEINTRIKIYWAVNFLTIFMIFTYIFGAFFYLALAFESTGIKANDFNNFQFFVICCCISTFLFWVTKLLVKFLNQTSKLIKAHNTYQAPGRQE